MESVIFANTATSILAVIALFATIFSLVITNRTIAGVVQIAGFLCVLTTITYALLLGASLTEILIFLLIFLIVGALAFIPKKEQPLKSEDKQETTPLENSPTERDTEEGEDNSEL